MDKVKPSRNLKGILILTITFLFSSIFYMKGIFLSKHTLTDKTDYQTYGDINNKKVIMILVDALREDFVEMD